MDKYPDPIPLPENTIKERNERKKAISVSIKWGVALRSFIVLAELCAVAYFGSAALFMDALSTGIDIAASLLLLFFIKLADRPPDTNHPFGHGRFEPIAGFQLSLLLVIVGGSMLFQQSFDIFTFAPKEVINPYLWIIPAGAVLLLEVTFRTLRSIAKKNHSPALQAEAVHYRVDAISSIFAGIALGFGAYYPELSGLIDHGGAIAIAVLMIFLGINACIQNVHQLLDRKPEAELFKRVRSAALRANGVLETEKIGIQQYGPDALVTIDIEVNPKLSVLEAHEISQRVRFEIQKDWPSVRDVIVHIEPYFPNDH